MNRTAVSSSNLASVGYDSSTQILEVEFNKGGIYQYHGVPEHVHQELVNASSVGTYFAYQVKNNYQFTKVG